MNITYANPFMLHLCMQFLGMEQYGTMHTFGEAWVKSYYVLINKESEGAILRSLFTVCVSSVTS